MKTKKIIEAINDITKDNNITYYVAIDFYSYIKKSKDFIDNVFDSSAIHIL